MIQAPGEMRISKQEEGEDYYNHISMLKQSVSLFSSPSFTIV
jgi:hypothetical protein